MSRFVFVTSSLQHFRFFVNSEVTEQCLVGEKGRDRGGRSSSWGEGGGGGRGEGGIHDV